jgi:hypothetical protein
MINYLNVYTYIYIYTISKPETEGKTPGSKMRKIGLAMSLQWGI